MTNALPRRLLSTALLVAGLLACWQALFAYAGTNALTSPAETFAYAARLLSSASFYPHLIETARAFALALACALALGFLIGFTLGLHRFSGDVGEPVLVALYSIPKIALYPIVLLAFGIGMPAKVAFGAIHGVVPIAIFTLSAVRNLNPVYVKTARTLRLTPWQITHSVLLPAAIPEIFTGVRIGFSLTLIGTLLGEMFASQRGLGFLLMNAIGLHNIPLIMALTLILVVAAVVASAILLGIERRLRRYA
jgi:NitT/TauT family transport system permease protein